MTQVYVNKSQSTFALKVNIINAIARIQVDLSDRGVDD
jgi:hypothetical protein